MYQRILAAVVLPCFVLYIGCAPFVNEIPVSESELANVEGVQSVIVLTKNGERHEISDFAFTRTHLVGTSEGIPVRVKRENIQQIRIKGVRDSEGRIVTEQELEANVTTSRRSSMAILGGIGFGALGFLPSCGFALAVAGENGENEGVATLLFFALEAGAIALGAHLGYIGGKSQDQKLALARIEAKRKTDARKDQKQ